MKTKQLYRTLAKSTTVITALFIMSFSGLVHSEETLGEMALLDVHDKWQVARLFDPTQNQRKMEKKGYITIYDKLTDVVVDQALDNHFNRIESMMFTRVVVTDENGRPALDESGEIIVEDDGC